MITVIRSLIGWAQLAGVVRGRFLSLRTEEFVTAARLDWASEGRIILRHMLPSFSSHIIASMSPAIPAMILAETSLSFLGDGSRDASYPYNKQWLTHCPRSCCKCVIWPPIFPVCTGVVRAADGISFDVVRGKTLCVVGESGSGKSVTARSILQIVDEPGRITSGSMVMNRADGTSVDLAKMNPRGKEIRAVRGTEIAMIFQEPLSSLSPVPTVGNQPVEVLPLHLNMSKSGARARCIELLTQVEIPNPAQAIDHYTFKFSGGMRKRVMIAMALACNPQLLRVAKLLQSAGLEPAWRERYPHAFSRGQRQRIGIARAIALNPRIIVADEATAALDVSLRSQMPDLLLNLQDKLGLSFIFISHDIAVIRYFCDRVAVMYKGKVVETGPTDQVCDAPSHAYTQALLSTIPCPDPRERQIHRRFRYSVSPAILS